MPRVLVVDDIPSLAEQYAYDLRRLGDFETATATGGEEAVDFLASEPVDCIILDLEMPGMDGFDVLKTLKDDDVDIPVIVYTGTGDFDRCMRAIRMGAFSFIDKAESMQKVVQEVRNALSRNALEQEIKTLRSRAGDASGMIGDSAPMRRVKDEIARLAPIPAPVLITGESGTGKELVARELHRLSRKTKADLPFVAVNCAALAPELVESELFGHERGAFTGADRIHRGAFERAGRGVLFLDEIGELPTPAQAKLLRVLEEHEITRVGGEQTVRIHARILAATNRDLEREVAEHRFREDLYYRLNTHIVRMPALRERASDIAAIAAHLCNRACRRYGLPAKRISPEALDMLSAYEWRQNNVRELRNVIERMIIADDSESLGPESIPRYISGGRPAGPSASSGTFKEQKTDAERRIVLIALERNSWHISKTAADLGLADHASLLKIMRRHDLKRS